MTTHQVTPANRRPVFIVDGARTPFLRASKQQGAFSASDLAVSCGKALLLRQPFAPEKLDEVIIGCMLPCENEANIGRIIALRLGCGHRMPAWTVQRNCGTGMQALDSAAKGIAMGRADLVLAGGTEAMSRAPLLVRPEMGAWLMEMNSAHSLSKKLKLISQLRPRYFSPIIALLRGLCDPIIGMNMGQTAEELAYRFTISREAMDAFALQSHQRLARAQDEHYLPEVTTLYQHDGAYYERDNGLRRQTTLAQLAKLAPYFDKHFGMVTAGNSSQITDGAALCLLASEKAVTEYNLPVLGQLIDTRWAALDPAVMGLGPIMAATPLLQQHGLGIDDIDYWEINEAFAAQVLACLAAWKDSTFCRDHFQLEQAIGEVDQARLNIDGGAIALGHPVGSSGARVVLHLLHVLHRQQAKRGIASICIGGGQGGAMLVARV